MRGDSASASAVWCHVANHKPGQQDTLADGISRWEEHEIAVNVEKRTKDSG